MYFNVVFSEHCGLSPRAEIVAQLAAHVTRVSFVVLVLVLICFFSQTANLTLFSFCSSVTKTRKKSCWCTLYKRSSFSECQWLQVLERLFWFLSPCVRAAQSCSVTSCFLCVRPATFTLAGFSCSTELGIKHDSVLLNEDGSWVPEQSESLLKPGNVCVEECVAVVVRDAARLWWGQKWHQACSGQPGSWTAEVVLQVSI